MSLFEENGLGDMRAFDYESTLEKLFVPSATALIAKVHEGKAIAPIMSVVAPDTLEKLSAIAKVRSAGASCRIEGHRVTEKHLRTLLDSKEEPETKTDQAVLGYRYLLETVDNAHAILRISPATILQLHSDLFRYTPNTPDAGKWRGGDRARAAAYGLADMESTAAPKTYHGVRTDFVDAPDVASYMREICNGYNAAIKEGVYSPLLASLVFIVDFICICPFDAGTGEISRALMLLLLNKNEFDLARYIAIDAQIEATQEEYFSALRDSSRGWETGDNDYLPFIEYMLGVLQKCNDELLERSLALSVPGSNEKTIRRYFQSTDEPVSKLEILEANPMMSQKTLERILQKMLKERSIEKVGAARATRYRRAVIQIPQ